MTIGERTNAGPGSVGVVPSDKPHSFDNVGSVALRMTCIPPVGRMETEWLAEAPA